MFSSGSGMRDAAPSENIPDIGRSNPVLPGQDNQGYTSFPIHKTAFPLVQGPSLLAGHLMNLINNTNTAGVGSSQLPPDQPYYGPNPLGGLAGFWSEGDDYDQISEFELGGVTAPNLQSGDSSYSLQGSDPGGMQSRFPARLGVSNLQGADLAAERQLVLISSAVDVPALGDLSMSLDEPEELLGNTKQPIKRKRQVRSRSPDRDDGPGRAQPQLPQDPKLQELSKDQRHRARKKGNERAKDEQLLALRDESLRTRALCEAADCELQKAQKNIAHFRKSEQDTAKKVQDHLLGLVNASVEPRKDKEEWRKEIFSQNGNQAFDSLWEMHMSLKNQYMSTLALLIESAYMKGGDDIGDGVN